MSRLDELIKELCPNGVEYKELGEIAKVTIGEFVHKDKQSENAEYPVFNGGISNTGYYNDYNEEKDKIIMSARGANAGYINRVFVNYWAGNSCYTINTNDEIMNWNFLYYVLKNKEKNILSKQQTASIPSISKKQVEGILVPVPPLEVQEEIVRILDDYTKSVEELKEKLNKELIARKKQYSWYRDYLLKFENKVEIVKLKDIATEMYRGNGIKREEVREIGIPCVRYGEIYTEYDISFEETKSYTDENLITNKKYIEYGDILFAITGESVEEIGKSTAYIGKEKCLVGGDILVMKHKQDPVYLSYVLSTENSQKQKSKGKIKSKVVHTNATDIGEIEIPLPPLEVQKRIVEVLDNFEKICKELNIELSSEIEIKQKEYEFVRNYLLTFEEKSRQAILACELASLRSKQQAQNLIKILQYVYGYVEVRLGDISGFKYGYTDTAKETGNARFIRITDINENGKLKSYDEKYIDINENNKEYLLEKDDILMARTGATYGKTVKFSEDYSAIYASFLIKILLEKELILPSYYWHFAQSSFYWKQANFLVTGGGQPQFNANVLSKVLIPLPPLEEQQKIVD